MKVVVIVGSMVWPLVGGALLMVMVCLIAGRLDVTGVTWQKSPIDAVTMQLGNDPRFGRDMAMPGLLGGDFLWR